MYVEFVSNGLRLKLIAIIHLTYSKLIARCSNPINGDRKSN